ncbi:MAG: hypothetical protein AB1451_07805 [Nitrospirota bacterium]
MAAPRFLALTLALMAASMAVGVNRVDRMDRETVAMRMMGGMMPPMMRDMMSGRLPPGVRPEDLPDPDGAGAMLLRRYCTQCHELPSPTMHAADDWPAVEARMFSRMAMMADMRHGMRGMMRRHGMGAIEAPTQREQERLLAYLKRYALRPAEAQTLGPPDTPGLALFRQTCSRCHILPDPALHTPDEWPLVVGRMRENMERMGKPAISDQDHDEIVGYLRERSRQ